MPDSLPEELRITPRESFQRWTDHRIAQSGGLNNIGLTLATAILVLAPDLAPENPGIWTLRFLVGGIATALISAVLGIGMAINRTRDFVLTSEVSRRQWSIGRLKLNSKPLAADSGKTIEQLEQENCEARPMSKRIGQRTWPLLYFQLVFLGASLAALAGFGICILP